MLLKKLSDKYYVRGLARAAYATRRRTPAIRVLADPDGVRVECDANNYFQYNIGLGNYEYAVRKTIKSLLREGDTMIDVGCNIGYLSCVAAKCVGPNGRVHSIDPNPEVIRQTVNNARLNEFDWVRSHCVAASNADGVADFHVGVEHAFSTLISDSRCMRVKETISVPTKRVDDIVEGENVKLVKVDVEGHELQVLEGMERLIGTRTAAFIVEHTPHNHTDPESGVDEQFRSL